MSNPEVGKGSTELSFVIVYYNGLMQQLNCPRIREGVWAREGSTGVNSSFLHNSDSFVSVYYEKLMNENLYIAHKKLPHKTLRVHSARFTQCIHVSSRKLKLPKDTHTKRYKQLLPTHTFPKVELYTAVK